MQTHASDSAVNTNSTNNASAMNTGGSSRNDRGESVQVIQEETLWKPRTSSKIGKQIRKYFLPRRSTEEDVEDDTNDPGQGLFELGLFRNPNEPCMPTNESNHSTGHEEEEERKTGAGASPEGKGGNDSSSDSAVNCNVPLTPKTFHSSFQKKLNNELAKQVEAHLEVTGSPGYSKTTQKFATMASQNAALAKEYTEAEEAYSTLMAAAAIQAIPLPANSQGAALVRMDTQLSLLRELFGNQEEVNKMLLNAHDNECSCLRRLKSKRESTETRRRNPHQMLFASKKESKESGIVKNIPVIRKLPPSTHLSATKLLSIISEGYLHSRIFFRGHHTGHVENKFNCVAMQQVNPDFDSEGLRKLRTRIWMAFLDLILEVENNKSTQKREQSCMRSLRHQLKKLVVKAIEKAFHRYYELSELDKEHNVDSAINSPLPNEEKFHAKLLQILLRYFRLCRSDEIEQLPISSAEHHSLGEAMSCFSGAFRRAYGLALAELGHGSKRESCRADDRLNGSTDNKSQTLDSNVQSSGGGSPATGRERGKTKSRVITLEDQLCRTWDKENSTHSCASSIPAATYNEEKMDPESYAKELLNCCACDIKSFVPLCYRRTVDRFSSLPLTSPSMQDFYKPILEAAENFGTDGASFAGAFAVPRKELTDLLSRSESMIVCPLQLYIVGIEQFGRVINPSEMSFSMFSTFSDCESRASADFSLNQGSGAAESHYPSFYEEPVNAHNERFSSSSDHMLANWFELTPTRDRKLSSMSHDLDVQRRLFEASPEKNVTENESHVIIAMTYPAFNKIKKHIGVFKCNCPLNYASWIVDLPESYSKNISRGDNLVLRRNYRHCSQNHDILTDVDTILRSLVQRVEWKIRSAVYTAAMCHVHDVVIAMCETSMKGSVEELKHCLKKLKSLPLEDFDMSERLTHIVRQSCFVDKTAHLTTFNAIENAIQLLHSMGKYKTPTEMAIASTKALQELGNAPQWFYVAELQSGDMRYDEIAITSEDLLPFVSFVVVKGNLYDLPVYLRYLETFLPQWRLGSEDGYTLVTLQSVHQLLMQKDHQ